MIHIKNLIIIFSLLLLLGCASPKTPAVIDSTHLVSPTALPEKTPELSPPHLRESATPSQKPTTTGEFPTTAANTQSPAATPTRKLADQSLDAIPLCQNADLSTPFPSTRILPGTVLFQELEMQGILTLSDAANSPETLALLGNGKIFFQGISQNEHWFAYSRTGLYSNDDPLISKPVIELVSVTGQRSQQVVGMDEFGQYLDLYQYHRLGGWRATTQYWIGNELIPMSIAIVLDLSTGSHMELVYGLLNPFTGKWENEIYAKLPGWDPLSYVAFSPDMELALYEDFEAEKVILWDIETQRTLWEQPNVEYSPSGAVFQWSNNGTRAAYPINDEQITTLLRDGNQVPVPEIITESSTRKTVVGFQLSRDGNQVAIVYWLFNPDRLIDEFVVFVFDFQTEKYSLHCPIPYNSGNLLVWSPDNQYLSVGVKNFEVSQDTKALIVLDTYTEYVYQLADDGNVLGWISGMETNP